VVRAHRRFLSISVEQLQLAIRLAPKGELQINRARNDKMPPIKINRCGAYLH